MIGLDLLQGQTGVRPGPCRSSTLIFHKMSEGENTGRCDTSTLMPSTSRSLVGDYFNFCLAIALVTRLHGNTDSIPLPSFIDQYNNI